MNKRPYYGMAMGMIVGAVAGIFLPGSHGAGIAIGAGVGLAITSPSVGCGNRGQDRQD